MSAPRPPRVLVIGCGFAGICIGHHLNAAGIPYTILEKADHLGGTWRDNVYPGAACDVPSLLYSFSFGPKPDWSRKWATQPEILAYMERCARELGVLPNVRTGVEVAEARFDEASSTWRVRTVAGEELTADVLVSAVGQLSRPSIPKLPGLESFRGPAFHSARWDTSASLEGKRVAVIGNAASAVQLIPEVARKASELVVFQRSANWMLPRGDRPYLAFERFLFHFLPFWAWFCRALLWFTFDLRFALFTGNGMATQWATNTSLEYLAKEVKDPELRRRLTPSYGIGEKRILITDEYYQTLQRPNVRLVTDGIERVEEGIVATSTGERFRADVIVLATGFLTTEFLVPMTIIGRDGVRLEDAWRSGAEAYLGLTVAGFPNFFMMYGPNTNLGHNSIIFMLECQTHYILECIHALREHAARAIEIKGDVMRAYNDRIQEELRATIWAKVDRSWYKNEEGRIVNNWPGPTLRYWRETRNVDHSAYRFDGVDAE